MAATVSGCLLSALFFEHAGSSGDQEGILFGEISSLTTSTISDSQLETEKEETIISIHGFSSSQQLFSFYDNKGSIIPDQLEFLLQGRKNVVGWYKFRRNSSLEVSLREHALHRALLSFLPGITPQTFMFAIFTCSAAENLSTHDFDHGYFIMKEMQLESIPLNIVNLGDTADSKYKLQSNPSLGCKTGLYHDIVEQFRSCILDRESLIPGVHEVEVMYTSMEEKLQDLCNKVIASDKEVACLSDEVEELRQQLQMRQDKMKKKYLKDTAENHISASETEPICQQTFLNGRLEKNTPKQNKNASNNSSPFTLSKSFEKSSFCPDSPSNPIRTSSTTGKMDIISPIKMSSNLSCLPESKSPLSENSEESMQTEDPSELSNSPTF